MRMSTMTCYLRQEVHPPSKTYIETLNIPLPPQTLAILTRCYRRILVIAKFAARMKGKVNKTHKQSTNKEVVSYYT